MSPIETKIARKLIEAGLAMGYTVSVYDGEDWWLQRCTDLRQIIGALASTDSDWVRFTDKSGQRVGSILLIWGNEEDLISDYSDNELTEALLARAGL